MFGTDDDDETHSPHKHAVLVPYRSLIPSPHGTVNKSPKLTRCLSKLGAFAMNGVLYLRNNYHRLQYKYIACSTSCTSTIRTASYDRCGGGLVMKLTVLYSYHFTLSLPMLW